MDWIKSDNPLANMKIYKQLGYIKGFWVHLWDGYDEFYAGRGWVGVMIKRFGPWFRKFRILSCVGRSCMCGIRWKYVNCCFEPSERCILWCPILPVRNCVVYFVWLITSVVIITSIFLENSRRKYQRLIFLLIV